MYNLPTTAQIDLKIEKIIDLLREVTQVKFHKKFSLAQVSLIESMFSNNKVNCGSFLVNFTGRY